MRAIQICWICLMVAAAQAGSARASYRQVDYGQNEAGQALATQSQPVQAGQIALSSAGQEGQRQTRAQIDKAGMPLARVSNRIQNRVQSRLRNRIDQNYDPQFSSTSPFTIAEEQTRNIRR